MDGLIDRFVRAYTGSDVKEFKRGGTFFSTDPKCRRAVDQADDAMKLSPPNRLIDLIVVIDSSSEGEGEESEESGGEEDGGETDGEEAMEVDGGGEGENGKSSAVTDGKENEVWFCVAI